MTSSLDTYEVDQPVTHPPTPDRLALAKSRARLRTRIVNCRACPLHDSGWVREPVPFDGPLDPVMVVVGEAPGQNEDRGGRPFIGPAGQLMREMLREAGVDDGRVLFANTVSCVVGDSQIGGPSPTTAYRRWFVGEFLTLRTASGRQLTVTPNHPIATRRGWISASELHVGDNLISGTFTQEVSFGAPHVQDPPTSAEKIFGALTQAGITEWVVGTNKDFHGDGRESDVQIVSINGQLWDWMQSPPSEPPRQHDFTSTSDLALVSTILSPLYHPITDESWIHGLSSNSGVRRSDHRGDLLLRHELEPKLQGFGPSSELDVSAQQMFLDSQRTHVELTPQRFQALAGLVAFDPLVEMGYRRGTDWVYNFATHEGWYSSNGLIVHNCFPHGTPGEYAIKACRANLTAQLDIAHTPYTVLAGNIALQAWRPDLTVTKSNGRVFIRDGRVFMPILHPAYVLRHGKKGVYRDQVVGALAAMRDLIRGDAQPSWFYGDTCSTSGCGEYVDHHDPEGPGWCERHWPTRVPTWTELEVSRRAAVAKRLAVARVRVKGRQQGRL